jgi:hypothetical protein
MSRNLYPLRNRRCAATETQGTGDASQRAGDEERPRKHVEPPVERRLAGATVLIDEQGVQVHPTAARSMQLDPVGTPVGVAARGQYWTVRALGGSRGRSPGPPEIRQRSPLLVSVLVSFVCVLDRPQPFGHGAVERDGRGHARGERPSDDLLSGRA